MSYNMKTNPTKQINKIKEMIRTYIRNEVTPCELTDQEKMSYILDNEMIMISDTCMNEADSANGLPEEKSRYLSNPNLYMCWYIQFVDATNLSLIYMATGNTLTYRRVE